MPTRFVRPAIVLRYVAVAFVFASPALAQNGGISGRITERSTGEAVVGAAVNAARSGGGGAASTRSRQDGTYALTDLDTGKARDVSGKELASAFSVALTKQPQAALITYQRK